MLNRSDIGYTHQIPSQTTLENIHYSVKSLQKIKIVLPNHPQFNERFYQQTGFQVHFWLLNGALPVKDSGYDYVRTTFPGKLFVLDHSPLDTKIY